MPGNGRRNVSPQTAQSGQPDFFTRRLARQQIAVRGQRQIVDVRVSAQKLHELPQLTPRQGLAAREPDVMDAHRTDLDGYQLGKGSIRFQPDSPLPEALVRTLVAARIAELEGAP